VKRYKLLGISADTDEQVLLGEYDTAEEALAKLKFEQREVLSRARDTEGHTYGWRANTPVIYKEYILMAPDTE
jgi:hypothetical protein